ncbi:MAG: dTDP-4-dehydrorhamnose reductase [Dysgonamonadaceae bacterium]|jgi:dTDP-4-dehydrorhamnose reductase|nr:dTDP-4-dehydrorhamnose reductase [Dysgonamonadaceae bacterium]
MVKNILLTGANGQLGSEIRKIASLYPKFHLFPTDIDTLNICLKPEIEKFIQDNNINYVINCAAYTAVDKAESDIDACYEINKNAVQYIAEAAEGKAKVIHISTDYVFNGLGNKPLKETDNPDPQSVYGKSKRDGEQLLNDCCPENIIIRTAWLYSIYGNNFVKTMIRLGKEQKNISVVNDQFGTPTNAADLAQTIMYIITFAEEKNVFPKGIYHYTNEGVCTWFEFCIKIHELAGITGCQVNPIPTSDYPTPAKRPTYSVLDKTKIKEFFGIDIPNWEDSLNKYIKL